MTLNQHNVINSGFRGLVCAGLATLITASISWSFVASTDSLNWMGSSGLDAAEIAIILSESGAQSKGA
jgi:hypothetical protein